MSYSIGEVAKQFSIPASTLRYYDRQGLLPMVERKNGGIRSFTDKDLKGVKTIEYLKRSGMPIKDIKKFIDWCNEGDSSLEKRYQLFVERKKLVKEEIKELEETLSVIEDKCKYYEDALRNGYEDRSKCPFVVKK